VSDRPIQVGDLVQVVRGHECDLGSTFRVGQIREPTLWGWICPKCSCIDRSPELWADRGDEHGAPLSWLKRIPPLDELEGERTQENLKEPA
jgi:hypothetical protein